jgi:hypothetical protein
MTVATRMSGRPTPPPGLHGRIIPRTGPESSAPSPGSTPRSCATSPASKTCTSWSTMSPPNAAPPAYFSAAAPTSPAPTSTTGPPTASGCATPAPFLSREPRLRQERTQETSPSPTGSSTPGPNMTTGAATTRIPHHVAKLYNIPEIKPEVPPPPAAPANWKPGSPASALARRGDKPGSTCA